MNNLKMISFQRQKLIPDTKVIIVTHIVSESGKTEKQRNGETEKQRN